MSTKIIINVNRTTKNFRYTGLASFKETVDLEINNISDINPSSLVLSIFTKTKVQAIVTTGFTLSGTKVIGSLTLRSDVLESVFSSVKSGVSVVFSALLWDHVSDTVVFNGQLNIQNNPYDETLEPAPTLNIERFLVQYSTNGTSWTDSVSDGTKYIRMSSDSGVTYGGAILLPGANATGLTEEQAQELENAQSHIADSDIHVTAEEKEAWNNPILPSGFSGSYNDLSNRPDLSQYVLVDNLPSIPTKLSDFQNDSGFITSVYYNDILDKPVIPSGFSGSYNDLTDKPTFNLTWDNISGKPVLATVSTSGSYNDLIDKPSLFTWSYDDLTEKPTLFTGDYNDLMNAPILPSGYFSGDYNDLSNKPILPSGVFSGNYAELANIPISFNPSSHNHTISEIADFPLLSSIATSGDYADLINKPDFLIYALKTELPTIPTKISSFENDSGYLLTVSYDDITNKPSLFSGNYEDLSNKPTIFSGNYNDLSNQPDLTAYSLTTHNHNLLYATINHAHDGVYSLVSHSHDELYPKLTDGMISIDVIPNTKILWVEISSIENNAVDNHGYRADTTANTVSLILPANPNLRDRVAVKALNLTNIFSISGNGNNIEGQSQDVIIDVLDTYILSYAGGNLGWIVALDLGTEDLNFIADQSQGSFSYVDLINKPDLSIYALASNIPTVPTAISAFTNDSGYLTVVSYNDLTNKPSLFSGNYNDLTNKPTLFNGSYLDLTNKPSLFSGSYVDLSNKPDLTQYSLTSHNHTGVYATSGHNHDGVYATVSALNGKANVVTSYTVTTTTGNITPAYSNGDFQILVMTGAVTLLPPTTIPSSGMAMQVEVTTGSYILTVGSDTYTSGIILVTYYRSGTNVRTQVVRIA